MKNNIVTRVPIDTYDIGVVRIMKDIKYRSNICMVIHERSNSVIYYNWDDKDIRDFVRRNITENAMISVDKNVLRGWEEYE